MGGYGSGRPGARPVAEQSMAFSVAVLRGTLRAAQTTGRGAGVCRWSLGNRQVAAIGYTVVWRAGDPLLVLTYTIGEQSIADPIRLVSSPMPHGRVRWWFQCPHCRQRVGVLYNPSGRLWRCRHCHAITYQSSCESDKRLTYERIMGGALLESVSAPLPTFGPDVSARELALALRSTDSIILLYKALQRLGKREQRDYQRWLCEQRKGRKGRPPAWLRNPVRRVGVSVLL